MTFGIDIATYQATLDIGAAKQAGAEFVIVKSVASNQPGLAVADDYHNNIDRTIAAGLGHAKGHYAVPNSRNTPVATARFQHSIRYRPAATDVYMLDDEPLNTYMVFWRDDPAADYFEELHRLGVRYSQMWLYCPAALTRSSGPWPRINALRKLGLKIVWVSYGPNYPGPTGMVPDHDVSLGTEPGRIDGWDVRQFTSNWRVPGYSGTVDGNYSPHSIATLFAAADTAGSGSTLITNGEPEMKTLRNQKDGGCFIVGRRRIVHLGTQADLAASKKVFPYLDLTDHQFRIALIGFDVPYTRAVKGTNWDGNPTPSTVA